MKTLPILPCPAPRRPGAAFGALAAAFLLLSCASASPQASVGRGEEPQTNAAIPRAAMVEEMRAILADSALAPAFIGVRVVALDDGAVLFEQNGGKLFHTASNMKLLTTATALHRLPAGFRFTTALTTAGTLRSGTLSGDLVVRGGGDPLLGFEDLDSLAAMVASAGVHTIDGDLLGDVSRFDSLVWGKGWMWDDDPAADFPFLTPLTVRHNTIAVTVSPAVRPGLPAEVDIDPASDGFDVQNDAVTTADTLVPPLAAERVRATNTFRLSGRVTPGDSAVRMELTVWRPEEWFLALLRDRLSERGIHVRGMNAVRRTAPPGEDTLAAVSRSLDTVLAVINKESDNLSAELLLKTIAAERVPGPGSARAGLAVVKEYLAGVGIDTSRMILADGSGVSWYTAVSPEALTALLRAEYGQGQTYPRFRASLSVAGVDGKLRNRMKGSRAEGNAAAKTGTLSGVGCLSGYVASADGRTLAFSILGNHFPGEGAVLRSLQNTIVALLARTDVAGGR